MTARTVLLSLLIICYHFHLISCIDIEFKTGAISLPIPLTNGCSAQTDDGTIYILGGQSTSPQSGYSQDIVKLSTDTEGTTTVENLETTTPNSFFCHQNTVYSSRQNKIYIFGAIQPEITNPKQYIFDVDSSQFQGISVLSSLPYTTSPCVSITETDDNRELIYIYGGIRNDYTKSSQLNIFNANTDMLLDGISNAPYAIMSAACIAVDNYFYVFGGQSSNDDPSSALSDILRYSLDTNQWEVIGDKLLDKSWGAKAVLTPSMSKILIIGGHDTEKYLTDVEVFDIDTNTVENTMYTLANAYGGFVSTGYIGDDIVVLGGNINDLTYLDGSILITVTGEEIDEDIGDVTSTLAAEPTNTPVVENDDTDNGNQGDDSGAVNAVNATNEANFFETKTGLLVLILVILLVICICGTCIYRFASKRQGRGYGVVSGDENDEVSGNVVNEEHAVV